MLITIVNAHAANRDITPFTFKHRDRVGKIGATTPEPDSAQVARIGHIAILKGGADKGAVKIPPRKGAFLFIKHEAAFDKIARVQVELAADGGIGATD